MRKSRAAAALLVLFAVVTLALAAGAAGRQEAPAGPVFKVVGSWGGLGVDLGKFGGDALGLAVGQDGTVYVADSNRNQIQSFTAKGAFKQLFTFADAGTVPDVAVGPDGDVWGTTQVNTWVVRFPKTGGPPGIHATPKSAEGIAVDADGNVYVSTVGDDVIEVVRFDRSATDTSVWPLSRPWATRVLQLPGDIEASPDGSIYVADRKGSPPNIKRFDTTGKLLNTIKLQMQPTAAAGVIYGLGVDLDCNVWATNIQQRNIVKYSPTGKRLGAVTSGDLIGTDVAVGPTGDLYVFDGNTRSVIHFAEDRSKPAAAIVAKRAHVSLVEELAGWAAGVKYTAAGIACPSEIDATASIAGQGAARAIRGRAVVKVEAGKTTLIEIPLPKAALLKAAGTTLTATFKIVLKTNGRPTTQTALVQMKVPEDIA